MVLLLQNGGAEFCIFRKLRKNTTQLPTYGQTQLSWEIKWVSQGTNGSLVLKRSKCGSCLPWSCTLQFVSPPFQSSGTRLTRLHLFCSARGTTSECTSTMAVCLPLVFICPNLPNQFYSLAPITVDCDI